MRGSEVALWGLTLALVLLAAGAQLRDPAVQPRAIVPAELGESTGPGVAPGAAASELVDAVVAANIFSPTRAAPATRYTPYGAGGEPDETYPDGSPPGPEAYDVPAEDGDVGDPSGAAASRAPRLYGTMVGPGGATAVIRLDPAFPNGRVYREGERGNGYEVVKINARSVVLDGPQGRIEVRLARPEERLQ